MLTRRTFLTTASLTLASPRLLHADPIFHALPASLAALEKESHARLGVAILDTASAESSGYRAAERFPMCSTFKFLLAAAILQRADAARSPNDQLTRRIPVPPKPLLPHSPLTEPHAGDAMSLSTLCLAAVTQSDNTAANLLLDVLGGPAALTRFARALGDPTTRLDRTEPTLNESRPGDPRDTTTPAAMLADMRTLLLGNPLKPASRDLLTQWLIANQTGAERLRAGLPKDFRVGDKTGSDGATTTNDIAILWPMHRPPLLVTAFVTECPGPEPKRNAILAQVARLLVQSLQTSAAHR